MLGILGLGALMVAVFGSSGAPRQVAVGERDSLIVDQLAATVPNPGFATEATRILESSGYEVDYVSGTGITVDFYRRLPERLYDVIVFRVHAGRLRLKGETEVKEDAGLFTSEPYSRLRYRAEQADHRLFVARQLDLSGPSSFGIGPGFVESSMTGNFHGATIVLMGCDGLRGEALAAAFMARGAGTVIGWDELVTAERTDAATERLLKHLVVDQFAPQKAIRTTMAEIGPDLEYGSQLVVYAGK